MITALKNRYYRKLQDKEMVQYWKYTDAVEAKLTRAPEGHMVMHMKGEKYPFPGHPRGSLLYGQLSPLKHQIKNKVFNHIWARLENNDSLEEIVHELKGKILPEIFALGEKTRYDLVPPENLIPAVKEIWRAMTKVENGSEKVRALKEILCFILQEDDGYRNRVQWIVKFFPRFWKPTVKHFDFALKMLEGAEIVGDMKERQRLLRRVLMFLLKDPSIRARFEALLQEIDWNKVKLSPADKYFFRAKWFKVDWPAYKY